MTSKVYQVDQPDKNKDKSVKNASSHLEEITQKSAELHFVRNKLEQFQVSILKDVNKRMSGLIDEVLQEMRQHELQRNEFKHFANAQQQQTNTWNNRISNEADTAANGSTKDQNGTKLKTTSKNNAIKSQRMLPDKIFTMRESYLTALLEVNHMRAIYHIFYIILLLFFLNSVLHDLFVEGRVNFGLRTFKVGLRKIHYVALIWLLEHVFVFLLYYAFKGWALVCAKLSGQPSIKRFWSHSCLITYISSQLVFGYVASALCLKLNLGFIPAAVLLLESTRLMMKMHAFVRSNTRRVLLGKLKTDHDIGSQNSKLSLPLPQFKHYLYFLFAPTLVYRDHYPRTAVIRWKFALARFLEVVAIAFLYSYIYERHITVHFANYGLEPYNPTGMIIKFFAMALPSTTIFLCGFYLILHSWLNFTSELLRFGDRMFYKDWWTAYTYESYYRNWNIVVHDWLYEYVYKEFFHIFRGSKAAASIMVFALSAYVHEHLMGFALQVFFPVLFTFFAFVSVPLVFLTRNAPKNFGNILLWFSLIIGNTLMVSLYCMEYFARFNCPKTYDTWVDYVTPAVMNCYKEFRYVR